VGDLASAPMAGGGDPDEDMLMYSGCLIVFWWFKYVDVNFLGSMDGRILGCDICGRRYLKEGGDHTMPLCTGDGW